MGIDNIQLPSFVHQSIFKKNLVGIWDKIKISENGMKITFLGGNEKKIVFLAKDAEKQFLHDNHLKFLQDFCLPARFQ